MEDFSVYFYYEFHHLSCGLFIGQNKTRENILGW